MLSYVWQNLMSLGCVCVYFNVDHRHSLPLAQTIDPFAHHHHRTPPNWGLLWSRIKFNEMNRSHGHAHTHSKGYSYCIIAPWPCATVATIATHSYVQSKTTKRNIYCARSPNECILQNEMKEIGVFISFVRSMWWQRTRASEKCNRIFSLSICMRPTKKYSRSERKISGIVVQKLQLEWRKNGNGLAKKSCTLYNAIT